MELIISSLEEEINPSMEPGAGSIVASEQESAPLHHTAAERSTLTEEVDRASVQVVATEPTSRVGADQTALEDGRQENTDQNVNRGSALNGTSIPELTKESPPSYESVVKTTVIIPTDNVSTGDSDTDVVTTQPQSSITNSPMVDSANYNCDTLDPELAARIEYLRRRRRERKNADPDFDDKDVAALCCTICVYVICLPCMILGAAP